MLEQYFRSPMDAHSTKQQQMRERLIEAILDGALPRHEPLPSTRELADLVGVSRNTAMLVYQRLTDDGFLIAHPRRGHFIDAHYLDRRLVQRGAVDAPPDTATANPANWSARFAMGAAKLRNIVKPVNWREQPYPFVYGQVMADDIGLARWRDALRSAGSSRHAGAWIGDQVDADDPLLLAQILTRVLPQRGIRARAENLLITIGAQNALYLIAQALTGPGTRVGLEDPGYADAFNIFRSRGATLVPLPVDGEGVMAADAMASCDLICATPSHQCPTGATMSLDRRTALARMAREADLLVVEDDYEHELNFTGAPRAALKSHDASDRVIYAGSLTKTLFPGLRLGFVVAAPEVIEELRAVRRLMYRHPPALDQRAMAVFMAEGHLDAHLRRTRAHLSARWSAMTAALGALAPEVALSPTSGGSAIWARLPGTLDARDVARAAMARGVVIEAGDVHFLRPDPPRAYMRLGFAALPTHRIAPGVALLAQAIHEAT
ncbi:MAG: GntR family transcriptional regulator/MocR family aminotransferase [Paracoccaceae bacterium]|jgi:GntR family transcriptional regulator/MocR family aminotransferase